jgi:hypothetical protein
VKIDEQTFKAQPVTLGSITDDYTEIVTGLDEHQEVATVGSHLLKSELQRAAGAED